MNNLKQFPIYCKGALDKNQLTYRNSLNQDGIEIQLLKDFVDVPLKTVDYINILEDSILDVSAIHVPLSKEREYCDLQKLFDLEEQELLKRVCELAQEVANRKNNTVLVVLHNRASLADFKSNEEVFSSILTCLKNLLKTYPSIQIVIENVIPLIYRHLDFSNGCLPSYTDVIIEIRRLLDTDRIGSVLDTCHAITTCNTLKLIYDSDGFESPVELEDFFKVNKGICKLVHFANVKGLGIKEGTHGVDFESFDSMDLFNQLMTYYYKYIPGVPLTIEVLENDYLDCVNFKSVRQNIVEYLEG